MVNRFSLITLDPCRFLDAYKLQMSQHHVVIRHSTQQITRDAASGRCALSARAAAALHFRATVSQDAGARAPTASRFLRDPDQAEIGIRLKIFSISPQPD